MYFKKFNFVIKGDILLNIQFFLKINIKNEELYIEY